MDDTRIGIFSALICFDSLKIEHIMDFVGSSKPVIERNLQIMERADILIKEKDLYSLQPEILHTFKNFSNKVSLKSPGSKKFSDPERYKKEADALSILANLSQSVLKFYANYLRKNKDKIAAEASDNHPLGTRKILSFYISLTKKEQKTKLEAAIQNLYRTLEEILMDDEGEEEEEFYFLSNVLLPMHKLKFD